MNEITNLSTSFQEGNDSALPLDKMATLYLEGNNRSTWTYTPLEKGSDQIRLLALMPGCGEEDITCNQSIVALRDASEYEALSYTWGSPETTHSILLDGKSFPVTTNLYSAFQHLRWQEKPRNLWIDAVCIDQRNDIEKSAQVQLMGDIYRRASAVIGWLGMAEDDSDLALDFLNRRDRLFEDYSYTVEEPTPPIRPTERYANNPNKSCRIIIASNGYASLSNDEDNEECPRLSVSVPMVFDGRSMNHGLIERLVSEQIETAKEVFSQDDTILLPDNERCQQCKSHESPCWWNGEDQCISCLANFSMTTEPCSHLTLHGPCPELLHTGLKKKPVPGFYAYLENFTALANSVPGSVNQSELPQINKRLWLALYHLAARPWWQRTWILQEIAVNRSEPIIMCGNKTTSLKAVENFTSRSMAEAATSTTIGPRWMYFMKCTETFVAIRERMRESASLSLTELLQISSRLKSSDPRDRIFALLNLAHPGDRVRCEADYSLSVAEVYARTALHLIKTTKKLTIFGHNTAITKSLPSWVPDWSLSSTESFTSLTIGHLYSASKNYAAQTLRHPSLTTLTIRGFSVSAITHVSEEISTRGTWPTFSLSAFATTLNSLECLIFQAQDTHMPGENTHANDVRAKQKKWRFFRLFPDPRISDTFWRTLVCDSHQHRGGTEYKSPAPARWAELFELLRDSAYEQSESQSQYHDRREITRQVYGMVPEIPHLETPSPIQIPEDFHSGLPLAERLAEFTKPLLMQMALSMQRRRFFVMESGHMGLTSGDVRPGDIVHILLGGDVPFILRKRVESETDGSLYLIGEAYVHEFMHGESFGTLSHEELARCSSIKTFDII